MEDILVSVIIPTYNNSIQLKRAVVSVFNQSYKEIEIIVIDDGSTEDYSEVISSLRSVSPFSFHYFKKVNAGPGIARQYGLDRANGVFFQYLDSDDELLRDKIKNQVPILMNNKNIVMTYGLSMINNDPKKIHRSKNIRKEKDNLLVSVLELRKWHTSSCLWSYSNNGSCWSDLFNGEDVLHDFTIAMLGKQEVVFVPELVANINIENNQRLSNAAFGLNQKLRVIQNSIELNHKMYNKLKENKMLQKKNLKEPLAERFFYTAIKVGVYGDTINSRNSVKKSFFISSSVVKKMECIFVLVTLLLVNKKQKSVFKFLMKLRRYYLKPEIHQFRFVR